MKHLPPRPNPYHQLYSVTVKDIVIGLSQRHQPPNSQATRIGIETPYNATQWT